MKPKGMINNLDELRERRALLVAEQSVLGKKIVSDSGTALLALPVAVLTKPADPLTMVKVDGKVDIPAKVFSYLLPLLVNRTLFRRSGFVTRIVMGMIARRVGKRIGPKALRWLLRTIQNFIRNHRADAPRLPVHLRDYNRSPKFKRLK